MNPICVSEDKCTINTKKITVDINLLFVFIYLVWLKRKMSFAWKLSGEKKNFFISDEEERENRDEWKARISERVIVFIRQTLTERPLMIFGLDIYH